MKNVVFQGHRARATIALLALVLSSVWAYGATAQTGVRSITIGTASPAGVYYPAGQAICNILNKNVNLYGLKCTAKVTKGSQANIELLRDGTLDFAIVQSDVQYFAVTGMGPFKKPGAYKDLRAVMSLHPEPFTVIARADAGITAVDDLIGKRVNIGNPGSGQRTTMNLVMHVKGWTKKTFSQVREYSADKQAKALCANEVDAIIYSVGHPNASIKQTMAACDTVLVNVSCPKIDWLIKKFPFYGKARIAAGTYKSMSSAVKTIGLRATLVTKADMPVTVVHTLVKALFHDLVDFKFSHAALHNLNPKDMVKNGLTAPLHPGAIRFYDPLGGTPPAKKIRPAPKR